MSRPPDRSWMLATLIASSARAVDTTPPAPAAMAAAPFKILLLLTCIAMFPFVADTLCDQIFFEDRCPHGVFGIDHVSEPHAPGLAEQHVGVDLVETVIRAHPAHQFAI